MQLALRTSGFCRSLSHSNNMATTECRELPHLSLDLKDGNYDDVYKLLHEIKPMWEKEKIHVKVLSGGGSCHMLRCCEESGQSVTVRVRNNFEGHRNPEYERIIVKAMSSKGHFPPLLAMFQNGFCYDYIPGRPIFIKDSTEVLVTEEQLRCVARGMAETHTVAVPGFDYNKPAIYDFVVGLLSDVKPCFEGCPTKEELIQEIRLVEELVSVVKCPIVHMHGDSHLANIIWNEKQNKVTFVDWELSLVEPRAYDIGYFFLSIDDTDAILNIPIKIPSDNEQKFCKHYLTRWNELCNKPIPTEDEIDQLLLELKYIKLVVSIVRMSYNVKFAQFMSAHWKMESVLGHSLSQYSTIKNELFGMKAFGRPAIERRLSK